MLSYQHSYHSGNFADVLKHIVLLDVLNYLIKKDKPLCYVETHAGLGLYNFTENQAQKNREYLNGIGRIWDQIDAPQNVANYISLVKQFNRDGQLTVYPGSPLIAAHVLRANDRLICFERHPKEYAGLSRVTKADKRIKIFFGDGTKESLGILPPSERRGVVLIDPSYEIKTDYYTVIDMLTSMTKRFNTGCYLLWYPVLMNDYAKFLERTIKNSGIGNVQLFKLGIMPKQDEFGMLASGMIVINPPWALMPSMQQSLPWLADILGVSGQGYCEITQLVAE